MSYSLEDLCTLNPAIIGRGTRIELSLLTLKKESELIEEFGSLSSILENLQKDGSLIFKLIWLFVEDKAFFNYSVKDFQSWLFKISSAHALHDKLMRILADILNASKPKIKNPKRYKAIQEARGSGTTSSSNVCYATYYDALAKRYGYTLEQFFSLTMGQLHILLKTIGDESYKELEIEATLQGKKLKPKIEYEDISEEQEKEQDEQAAAMLKRLQDKYKQNKKG